jgi:hypothetical protein
MQLRQAQEAELTVRREREQLEQGRRELELTVPRRVEAEKKAAAQQATEQVTREYEARLRDANASLAEKDSKLKAAEEAELRALKLKQEAEEAKRQAELQVTRRMDEERTKVRDAAYRERDDEYRLKISEKDKLTTYHDDQNKYRDHWGISANVPPEASGVQVKTRPTKVLERSHRRAVRM